jgi:excisionase family DNA binding protein
MAITNTSGADAPHMVRVVRHEAEGWDEVMCGNVSLVFEDRGGGVLCAFETPHELDQRAIDDLRALTAILNHPRVQSQDLMNAPACKRSGIHGSAGGAHMARDKQLGQIEIIPFDQADERPPERQATLLLRVSEAAPLLGISERHLYDLLRAGVIPAVRLGRSVRVSKVALERFIASQEDAGTK